MLNEEHHRHLQFARGLILCKGLIEFGEKTKYCRIQALVLRCGSEVVITKEVRWLLINVLIYEDFVPGD